MAKNNQHVETGLTPDLAQGLLKVQQEELLVRQKEIELAVQQTANNKEIALKSIEANAEAGTDFRKQFLRNCQGNRWLVFGSLVVIAALCAYALHLGNAELVETIIKVAAGACGGLGIGYHLGLKRRTQNPKSQE